MWNWCPYIRGICCWGKNLIGLLFLLVVFVGQCWTWSSPSVFFTWLLMCYCSPFFITWRTLFPLMAETLCLFYLCFVLFTGVLLSLFSFIKATILNSSCLLLMGCYTMWAQMLVNRLPQCRRLTCVLVQECRGVRVGGIGLACSWACHLSDCAHKQATHGDSIQYTSECLEQTV